MSIMWEAVRATIPGQISSLRGALARAGMYLLKDMQGNQGFMVG